MIDWIVINQTTLWRLAAFAGVTALACVVLVPWLFVRMPADYFSGKSDGDSAKGLSLTRKLFWIGKNVLGATFLLVGLAMVVLPGPGFLVILVGLGVLSFPGKHRLVRKLVSRPAVLKPINKLRRRAGVPPLVAGR